MPVSIRKFYSEFEYLEMERLAKHKSEFFRGEIFAMSGATYEHNQVSSNLLGEIIPFLKNKPCKIFGSDLRVHVQENTFYTYPDAVIVCGKPSFIDNLFDTVTNPVVVFEILSATTREYDQTIKFELYKSNHSLREYILIDSQQVKVNCYRRDEHDSWHLSEYSGMDDKWEIIPIGYAGTVSALYEGVEFNRDKRT
jgi:Uma2 family endonuclease